MTGGIKAIDLPNNSVELAIVSMMIHEVQSFEEALKELALPIIQQTTPAEGMYLLVVGKKLAKKKCSENYLSTFLVT